MLKFFDSFHGHPNRANCSDPQNEAMEPRRETSRGMQDIETTKGAIYHRLPAELNNFCRVGMSGMALHLPCSILSSSLLQGQPLVRVCLTGYSQTSIRAKVLLPSACPTPLTRGVLMASSSLHSIKHILTEFLSSLLHKYLNPFNVLPETAKCFVAASKRSEHVVGQLLDLHGANNRRSIMYFCRPFLQFFANLRAEILLHETALRKTAQASEFQTEYPEHASSLAGEASAQPATLSDKI